jgi:hypothetical protein
VDLSGLQFGNALLSALGIPDRDRIECFAADFALLPGELQTRALLLATTSDITTGGGVINLRTETLAYQVKTEAKHLTIGALPAPISITGSFKDPGAFPDITKLVAAVGRRSDRGCCSRPRPSCRLSSSVLVTTIGATHQHAAANSGQRCRWHDPSKPAATGTRQRVVLNPSVLRTRSFSESRRDEPL